MHEHAGAVLVLLSDLYVRLTRQDGAVADEHGNAGEVSWQPAATHVLENLSQQQLKAILVELK